MRKLTTLILVLFTIITLSACASYQGAGKAGCSSCSGKSGKWTKSCNSKGIGSYTKSDKKQGCGDKSCGKEGCSGCAKSKCGAGCPHHMANLEKKCTGGCAESCKMLKDGKSSCDHGSCGCSRNK